MFRFDLRAFAHDGEISAAGERPERTEPVSPTSWDFAGSICSLYLKLSPPNRGRQFVFCQPQLDKIQCLPLTKYAHFWMSQPYENTFIKMYENKPISPCNKMTKPLILAFKPNSRAICILLRMILHFATSHRSNSHCFRIRSAALARKSAGASISSTGPKLRSRMRSSVSSCRSYQSLTVMVSESVSRSVRFS